MANSYEEPSHKAGRPFFVWILMIGLVLFGLGSAVRLWSALRGWEALTAFGTQPGPLYVAVSGGVFALAFFAAALALALRLRGAAWVVRVTTIAYAAWFWIDRLVLDQGENPENMLFLGCLTALFLLFALAAVWAEKE